MPAGTSTGSNYLNVDLLNSDAADDRAQEVYVLYRHTFDLGRVMDRKFATSGVRGLGVTAGFDWNTKNDPGYGSRKRMLVLGPTVFFDVPGFLNAGVFLLYQSNQPAAAHIARYTYDLHAMLGLNWAIPLGRGFSFEGYLNYIGAKGLNEFGGPTAPEFNFDGQVMYDLSGVTSLTKNTFKLGFDNQVLAQQVRQPTHGAGLAGKDAHGPRRIPLLKRGAAGFSPRLRSPGPGRGPAPPAPRAASAGNVSQKYNFDDMLGARGGVAIEGLPHREPGRGQNCRQAGGIPHARQQRAPGLSMRSGERQNLAPVPSFIPFGVP